MDDKYIEKITNMSPIVKNTGDDSLYRGLGVLLVERNKYPEKIEFNVGILLFMLDYNKSYELSVTIFINGKEIEHLTSDPHTSDKKINLGTHYVASFGPEIIIKDFPLGVYEFKAELKDANSNDVLDIARALLLVGEVPNIDTFRY